MKIFFLLFLNIFFLNTSLGFSNLELDNAAYELIDRWSILKKTKSLPNIRPVDRLEVASRLLELNLNKTKLTGYDKNLLEYLMKEFSTEIAILQQNKEQKFTHKFKIKTRIENEIFYRIKPPDESSIGRIYAFIEAKNFACITDIGIFAKMQTDKNKDKVHYNIFSVLKFIREKLRAPEKITTHPRLYSKTSYIKIKIKDFLFLQYGRDELCWGPGASGALLISNNSIFDMFNITVIKNTIRGQAIFAVLVNPQEVPIYQYLSAHRLEYSKPYMIIGIGEVVIYDEGSFNPGYLNPLGSYYFYHSQEQDAPLKKNANILLSMDITFLIKYMKIYTELLLDHISMRKGHVRQCGLLVGTHLNFNKIEFCTEYVHIDKWTYHHTGNHNKYINQDKVIGYWLGPYSNYFKYQVNLYHISPFKISLGYKKMRYPKHEENILAKNFATLEKIQRITDEQVAIGLEFLVLRSFINTAFILQNFKKPGFYLALKIIL